MFVHHYRQLVAVIGEPYDIKHTFCIKQEHLREEETDGVEEMKFCIGKIENDYVHFDSEVIGTDNNFYFSCRIHWKYNLFVASRGISILRKIDKVIDRDFYVGGDWENNRGISEELYLELIEKFPKTAEIDKYVHHRISNILKEQYPECDKYEQIYDKYMRKQNTKKADAAVVPLVDYNRQIEFVCKFKLCGKNFFLLFSRRKIVMIIKAYFADCHNFFIFFSYFY